MRLLTSFVLTWSILIVQSSAAILPQPPFPQHGLISHTRRDLNLSLLLPLPSQDPWFQPPSGWEQEVPGTPLRTRASPYKDINIGNCIDTFQVLYRTTDSNNNASWAVTTVFIPASHAQCSKAHPENCSHAIVSYEVPYDSADFDASPSYLLQFSEPYGEIYDLLTAGYFVSVADYEGPLASYCAGVQSGHATLDSVRAVLQVAGNFGLRISDARAALWGYSGGATATEFAAELAASYAPDLKLAGIVHGGLVPNTTDAESRMNSEDTQGLVVAGMIGITSQHPEARQYLDSRLKQSGPRNATRFYEALGMNGVQVLLSYEGENVYDYFINGSADLNNPILQDMYNKDAVFGRHGVPNMPVFVYKAIQDQMSPAPATDALVDSFCKQGANILYHRNRLGGHNDELWQGRGRAMAFLSTVLDDTNEIEFPKSGCQIVNVTVAVNVTLQNKQVMEGSKLVDFSAITVEPVNATLLPNGSVLWPMGNSTVLIINPIVNKRAEHLGFSDLMKRWKSSSKSTRSTLADVRNRLDVLSPPEWRGSLTRSPFSTLRG